jgi:hypothetical protein
VANDPVLIAYAVRRSPKTRRVQYERIGRAYPHNTGEGLTLILEAMPLKGRHIVLLELDEADDRRLLAEAKRQAREHKGRGPTDERKSKGSRGGAYQGREVVSKRDLEQPK